MEKWVPYLDNVGFDPQKARYIGDPIDYIIFDDNEVLFLEIKTGEARLNKHQSKVKTLIETGKVSFKTLRIK
jgi:predicted Holliday junction resolvase-like endonuclease